MKFGGTSVEGATAFKNAARLVFDRQALRPVVVVSAMAGFTDALFTSVQQALEVGHAEAAASLEKHFDRHLRVIEALLNTEAQRMAALVAQSRVEITELLRTAAAEVVDARDNEDRQEDAQRSLHLKLLHMRRCVLTPGPTVGWHRRPSRLIRHRRPEALLGRQSPSPGRP